MSDSPWKDLARFATLLAQALPGDKAAEDGPPDALWEAVKVVHADELRRWTRFQPYETHTSIKYSEYQAEAARIAKLGRKVRRIPATIEKIEKLDHDGLEEYEKVWLPIPRSLLRRPTTLPLPEPKHEGTVFMSYGGEVTDEGLIAKRGWRKREVMVYLSCPSSTLHADEIAQMRRWLDERSEEELATLREVETSRFAQPVLFVSHRWHSPEHPDPDGTLLKRLRVLRDCWVIYDFSSFPQSPRTEEERASLQLILENMGSLIENVAILDSPDYTTRGWCLYEYLVSSFQGSVVCDEVRDKDFVALRNWCGMPPPPPLSSPIKGHSIEASVQNSINENILNTVNRILPQYKDAGLTVEGDRAIVTELLIRQLEEALPAKKEYQLYLGEWKTVPWTREELENAFSEPLQWESLQTYRIFPDKLDVPATLEEAVERRYEIAKPPPQSPYSATWKVFKGLFGLA